MGIGLNMVEMSECDTYVNLMQIFKNNVWQKVFKQVNVLSIL